MNNKIKKYLNNHHYYNNVILMTDYTEDNYDETAEYVISVFDGDFFPESYKTNGMSEIIFKNNKKENLEYDSSCFYYEIKVYIVMYKIIKNKGEQNER